MVIKPEQPKMTCWLCFEMVQSKCDGFSDRTVYAKDPNLKYCFDTCLGVVNEMKSMRQTKGAC